MYTKKGFTLIELLVVIAILAILSVAIVVVLNPSELIKRGRDSTRLSDLAAINSAISLYLVEATTNLTAVTCNCTFGTTKPGGAAGSCTTNAATTVAGSGWVAVPFTSITGGSPISNLPLDPVNNATYYYAYSQTTSNTFEIDAHMESVKYASYEGTDGGNQATWYEIGNDPDLNLL